MKISRRKALMSALFGAGYVGLRSLATGLPVAALLPGSRKAFAEGTCIDPAKAQFIIFSTSGQGDPINANAPGTYGVSGVVHCPDPAMAATPMTIGGKSVQAAKPWTTLDPTVLQRTSFWHIMTNTPVHPKEPEVLRLQNSTQYNEMLPSLLAQQLAPCLGTVQSQPITIGARTPSEGLSFQGQTLPIIPPTALAATLTAPSGPLANLTKLRDQTLSQLDGLYRATASSAQKKYLDSLINSQSEVRNINQDLLSMLSAITDDQIDSQITAAIALVKMKVTPVVAIHIPFGGDNHNDNGLVVESAQTQSGVANINSLMAALASNQLSDQVTFMTLNVFGRTLGSKGTRGRDHNENHHVSVVIGKGFKSSLIGGVGPVAKDFGALAIDSTTGKGGAGGDIAPLDSLSSYGKTMLAAVGADSAFIDQAVFGGKVVPAALA
jgi:uncharacterized protein DUF1501